MDLIVFRSADDAQELVGALHAEGYTTSLREDAGGGRWLLEVRPFDDGVVAMVDVYGGWLPDDPR